MLTLTDTFKNTMIIIISADYNTQTAYNLLKHTTFYRFQQIIEDLAHYEHNWKSKRKRHHIEVFGI